MLLCIWLMLQPFISIVHSEACAKFHFGLSYYETTFVRADYSDCKTWNELKETCEQSGNQLVSITTSKENYAILNFLQENCTRGDYAIGLSRQMGMPRDSLSSWNWESGDTAMELFWGTNEPNVENSKTAVVYMTTLDGFEPGIWYDIESTVRIGLTASPGYGYICERSKTTTHLSTTIDGTSIQSITSSIPSGSTYRRHTSLTTVNGENNERTGITDDQFTRKNNKATTQLSTTMDGTFTSSIPTGSTYRRHTSLTTVNGENNEMTGRLPTEETNTEKNENLMVIVLVSLSPAAAIAVLILIYRFREPLCCKSNTKMNTELLMDNILDDSTENRFRYGDNEEVLKYNGMTHNRSSNMPGQGKGLGTANSIKTDIPNSPSNNALEMEKYPVDRSTNPHDRENPNDYESEENPTYESYQKLTSGISSYSESEVDNPAYDALLFEAASYYSSPHEMTNVADSVDVSKNIVASGTHVDDHHDNVADSNIVAVHTKPDMSMKRKYHDKVADSYIDALYAKPDMSMKRKHHENVADSNIDALYAKPDMSMKRKHHNNVADSNIDAPYAKPLNLTCP